jgi:HK97 family phage portal protein
MVWPLKRKEQRSSNFISFGDLILPPTAAGTSVTPQNCIEHPAVYRCLDLNSSTIASFPVDCMKKVGKKRVPYPEPPWLRSPNDYQDFHELVAEAACSCDQYDSAFILKAVATGGQLVGLGVLDPNAVEMKRVDLGSGPVVVYDVQLANGKVRLAANEVLRVKAGLPVPGGLRGVSPTVAAREVIGLGLAARQYGSNFYGNGATLSGLIETPNQMTQEVAERLKESFAKKHGGVSRSHAIGILSGGAKWVQITTEPDKAQALDTLKYTDGVIASLFGIPAEYVSPAIEGAKGYVTGLYQRQMLWYQTGLYPRIVRLERAFSSLLPRPAYIKFRVEGWLRMDPEQRISMYRAGQMGEWLTINEIRALEDLNPLPGGDEPLKSVQWHPDQDEAAESGLFDGGDQ